MVLASGFAAILCLVSLGRQPLSWDESVTLNAAQRSPGALWTLLHRTDAPLGVYYAGMHGWLRLGAWFGIPADEIWMRLPSAIAVIAAIGLATWFGCRALGPGAGLAGGLLLAAHPLVVFYAQDARPYAIGMFLAVLATIVLLSDLRHPRPVTLAVYGFLALLLLYVQFWSFFVVAAHGVLVLVRSHARRRYVIVGAIVGAAVLPLVVLSQRESGEIGWIPAPTPATIASFLVRLCGGVGGVAVMALLAVALIWRRRSLASFSSVWRRPDDALAVSLWVLLPPIGLVLLSFWQPMMVPRYALAYVPAWAIALVAVGLRLPRRLALAIGALMLVVSLVSSMVASAQPYKYEDFRAAAADITSTERPGDAIVYIPSSFRVGLAPYLSGADHRAGRPADILLADPTSPQVGAVIGGTEVAAGREVATLIDAQARIYLIGPSLDARPTGLAPVNVSKESALRSGFVAAWHHTYGQVTVTLLTRASG